MQGTPHAETKDEVVAWGHSLLTAIQWHAWDIPSLLICYSASFLAPDINYFLGACLAINKLHDGANCI